MLDLMQVNTPREQWLKTLAEDFDRVAPLATAVLKECGAYEDDTIAELTAAWLRRHPQGVADAALLLLNRPDDALETLRNSLALYLDDVDAAE